ncbi:phage tail tube protein [Cronobacter sakazakii]|uniref:phage tail tube protein n=1 Tax=Cronobacter sakazakii TaxID=28141 RepID=UPI000CFD1907|nr:phage tail tube protein [Cronobacter sakazakii]EMC4149804.1 phage tail protein [Cronobacter sakazakii]MCI0222334.1 phage tail protein [Cronobacter sakazakii]
MTSKYEVTKGMTFAVSAAPVTQEEFNSASFPASGVTWLEAACATKEISFTGGQKGDIDVTTLCSTEQEQTNGLAAPAEMSITRNWVGDEEAQEALQTAYENDELRALRVVFPSGNGYYALVEVRQSSWSAATSSVVAATYSLRVRGKTKRIYAAGS